MEERHFADHAVCDGILTCDRDVLLGELEPDDAFNRLKLGSCNRQAPRAATPVDAVAAEEVAIPPNCSDCHVAGGCEAQLVRGQQNGDGSEATGLFDRDRLVRHVCRILHGRRNTPS